MPASRPASRAAALSCALAAALLAPARAAGAQTAGEVLLQADMAPTSGGGGGPRPLVLAAWIAGGGALTALVAWVAAQSI